VEKIKFQTNIPQEVILCATQGKEVPSQYAAGGKEFMFTTTDGRTLFLPPSAADKLTLLRLAQGEPVRIGRVEVIQGHQRRQEWVVERVAPSVSQAAGAPQGGNNHVNAVFAPIVQSIAPPPAPGNGANGHANGNGHANATNGAPRAWAAADEAVGRLVAESKVLIDGFAEALNYASAKYGNAMRPEDIRSLVLSAYIQAGKGGRY
jgi:hypothetical protein